MADKMYFRMSEIGYCPRALVANRLRLPSEEAPPWLITAAKEGKMHEQWIKNELRDEGYVVEDCKVCPICLEKLNSKREGLHVELEYDKFVIIGHTDGRIHRDGKIQGLEIKSMSLYEFDRWYKGGFAEFPQYAAQITFYMEADRRDSWLYIVKNRSSGYQPRITLTTPPANIQELIDRTNSIVDFINRKELPDAEFRSDSIECRRCLYKQNCMPVLTELDPIQTTVLTRATQDWRTGNAMEKEGKALKERATSTFEFHSNAIGMDKWRFNGLNITYVHVKEGISYPKENLLLTFTEEQLKPASKIKLAYDFIKVYDTEKDKKEETGDATLPE